jgi:hypothetical protein
MAEAMTRMRPFRYFLGCIQSVPWPEANRGKLKNMATGSMTLLTPHDANVIAELVQFRGMPEDKKKELLAELQEEDARLVGQVLIGVREHSSVSPEVRATVDRYRAWVENNKRLRRQRDARRRSSRSR